MFFYIYSAVRPTAGTVRLTATMVSVAATVAGSCMFPVRCNAAAVRRAAFPVLLMAATVIVAATAVQRRIFPAQATAVFAARFTSSANQK